MKIELWRDTEGYRMQFEDAEFDLTSAAFDSFIGLLDSAREEMATDSDYRVFMFDLAEEE